MRLLTVLLCLALTGAGASLAVAAGLDAEQFYRVTRVVAIGSALLILARQGRLMRLVTRDRALALFLIWAGLSAAWAVDLSSAISGAGMLFAAVVAGALFAEYGARAAAWLARFVTWLCLASLALWLVAPSLATVAPTAAVPGAELATGRLSGVFAWNADMGFVAAIGAILTLSLAMATKTPGKWLLATGVNMTAVLLSGSATAIVATAAAVLVLGIRFRPESPGMRTVRTLTLPAALVAALLYVTGDATVDDLLGLLGKDETLTGRTAIWEVATSSVHGIHVWIGAGLESFWASVPGLNAAAMLNFAPGHAHNGFIQTYLDLGWVGLGLFAVSFVLTLPRAVRIGRGVQNAAVVGAVVLFTLANLTNNYIVAGHLLLACYAWAATTFRTAAPGEPALLERGDGQEPPVERATDRGRVLPVAQFDGVQPRRQP